MARNVTENSSRYYEVYLMELSTLTTGAAHHNEH